MVDICTFYQKIHFGWFELTTYFRVRNRRKWFRIKLFATSIPYFTFVLLVHRRSAADKSSFSIFITVYPRRSDYSAKNSKVYAKLLFSSTFLYVIDCISYLFRNMKSEKNPICHILEWFFNECRWAIWLSSFNFLLFSPAMLYENFCKTPSYLCWSSCHFFFFTACVFL